MDECFNIFRGIVIFSNRDACYIYVYSSPRTFLGKLYGNWFSAVNFFSYRIQLVYPSI